MSLKIFYLTTEIIPFANTSSLADFSAKVPLLLQNKENDIRTIIPKYGYVSERKYILREVIRLREIPFEFGEENVITSAKSAFIPKTRVQVYFLEDDKRFKPLTNLIYKAKNGRVLTDNDMRFAYFSKASLAILPHLFWRPEVLWCNDWQSALVPAFYKQHYTNDEFYAGMKSVLVVHNYENEFLAISRNTFKNAGLEEPASMKKGEVNAYEAAAEYVDLIIAIDSPNNQVSKKLLELPAIKKGKSKVLTIKTTDDESPDYDKVAARIDDRLQKLFS
jgi:starch synthase